MAIRDQHSTGEQGGSGGDLSSAMARLSSLALSKTDPDRIISKALGEIRKTLKARMCWMFLVEEGKTILKSSGDVGSRKDPGESGLLLKLSPKTLKRTYPIICNRVGDLYRQNRALHGFLRQRKIEKFMGVLLKKDGRSIGVLNVGRDHKARDFTREDLRSLTALGSMLVVSRLRAAESESEQAQSFLEGIIENTPNPIFIKDRKHRYVVLNQAFSELLGHSRDQMFGKSDHDFFPKDQADFFRKKDEEMFRTGKMVDIPEEPATDKDGNLHYVHTKKAPLRDSSGKITHLVGIIEDITGRLQSESVLRESEQKYRLLVENIREGICSVEEGMFTNVNESMCRMFGYTKEEMLGMPSWNLAVPARRNTVRELFFAKATKGDFSPAEVECVRRDGSVFVAEIGLSTISGERQFLGVVSDITERKRAEEALRESEEKYRLLIESSDAAITFFDKNGTYLFLNSFAAGWLKGKPEDYIGKTVYDVFPKGLAAEFVKRFRRIIKSGVGQTIEEFVEQPLGGRFISSNLQPVRDKSGKIVGVQIVTHDITERKRVEEELRKSESEYRTTIDAIDDPIHVVDTELKFTMINAGFRSWLRELRLNTKVIGRTLFEAFPFLPDKVRREYRRVLRTGKMVSTVESTRIGSREITTETRKIPVFEDKRVVRIVTIVKDITERRKTEEEIRKFKTISDRAGYGSAISDLKGNLIYANESFAQMHGYRPEELVGKYLRLFHSRGQMKDVNRLNRQLMEKGRYVAEEVWHTKKDGVVFPTLMTATVIKDDRGQPMFLSASITDITKRKEVEEALKESEEKFRTFMQTASDLMLLADENENITYANESMVRSLGYSIEEMIGMNIAQFLTKEALEKDFKTNWGEFIATGEISIETTFTAKDGKQLHGVLKAVATCDSNGKYAGSRAVFHDLTERKRAEEALKQGEEKYRLLVENLTDMIVEFDTEDRLLFVSPSYCRAFGKSEDEMLGKKFMPLIHKDDRENVKKSLAGVYEPPHVAYVEERAKTVNGWRWQSWVNTAVLDRNDNIVKVVAVGRDITESKQAEEAVRKSEAMTRALLNATHDVALLIEADGHIVALNAAAAATLGQRADELIGKRVYDIFPPEVAERRRSEVDKVIRTGKPVRFEDKRRGKWFDQSAYPVLDSKGKVIRLAIFARDITEQKQAQQELQKSEDRYRSLFEDSPISLWEEDFSLVKKYIDRLRGSGTKDFRRYFETHPKAVAKCASLVKVIDVNRASLRLYKARNKEDLKSGLGKIFARESYYPLTEELIAIAEGQTRFQKDADIRTLRRDTRHVSVTWSVAPGHEETLSKVVVAIADVTEAKEAEEELRIEKERYRTLVETAQEGIGIVDPKENLVFVNRAFASLLGYRKDELLGKNLKEISPEAQYDVLREETKKRKQNQLSKYEITLLTKKGKPKSVYVSAAPLWNEDGSFRGTMGVVSDLTEIKKAREYNILLNAGRSLSRTLRLDQVLKLGAKKMAQALNADRCVVTLPEDDVPGFSIRAQVYSFPRRGKESLSAWSLKVRREHRSLYERSLQTEGSIQIPDLHSDRVSALGRKIVSKSGMASALVVPMFSRSKLLGAFHVGMRRETRTFTADQVRLARTMANQVAAALQNSALMEDLKKEHDRIIQQAELLSAQYREQKMMFELTQTLSSSRSLDRLLASAARKVTELLKTERASIALVDPGGESCSVKTVHFPDKPPSRNLTGMSFSTEIFPELKTVLVRHQPFVLTDVSLLPKEDPIRRYFLGQGIKSTVAMPLLYRGKCLGFLTAATLTDVHHYTEEELRLLRTISNPIAVTIENYRLLEDLRQKYAQIEDQAAKLKKQTWEKDILLRVGRALSKTMDLDQVGRVASQVVGSTLEVERCAITLVTKEDYELTVKGLYSKDRTQDRKLIGTKFLWNDIPDMCNMIKRRKPFVIQNTSDVYPEGKTKEYFLNAGIKSVLGTGMFFGDKLVGILSITTTKKHRTFSQEEVKLVQNLANQIGVAIENARLQQVVEKHAEDLKDLYSQLLKTQEHERKNIAQELHDQVGQMLQSMKMNLDRMKINLNSRPQRLEGMEDRLLDTEELLGQTIEDIRTLTFELRPAMLDDFGLIPTLRWYIDNYARRSDIRVSLKTKDKDHRFPPEVEEALYRIIQEALTNVAKHAEATEASVSVSEKGATAVLSVRDNGVGFDPQKALSVARGMGLASTKERVDMLGGSFEIISRPRKGTKLNIQIPFSGGAV